MSEQSWQATFSASTSAPAAHALEFSTSVAPCWPRPRPTSRYATRVAVVPEFLAGERPSPSGGKVDPVFRPNDAPAKRDSIGFAPRSGSTFGSDALVVG